MFNCENFARTSNRYAFDNGSFVYCGFSYQVD